MMANEPEDMLQDQNSVNSESGMTMPGHAMSEKLSCHQGSETCLPSPDKDNHGQTDKFNKCNVCHSVSHLILYRFEIARLWKNVLSNQCNDWIGWVLYDKCVWWMKWTLLNFEPHRHNLEPSSATFPTAKKWVRHRQSHCEPLPHQLADDKPLSKWTHQIGSHHLSSPYPSDMVFNWISTVISSTQQLYPTIWSQLTLAWYNCWSFCMCISERRISS